MGWGNRLPLPSSLAQINDDRSSIQPSDQVLLIVEDDINFARILLDMARQQGFKGLSRCVRHWSDTSAAIQA